MQTSIIALTCALAVTACGADSHPAEDPDSASDGTSNSAVAETRYDGTNDSNANSLVEDPDAPDRAAGTTRSTTATGEDVASSPPTTERPATTPNEKTAAAVNNPGAADKTKDADNTKINERDRGSSTLTPIDQGNSDAEVEITAAVRRAVVGDKNLSFTAKNVKIITVGTKVTLRGPVNSDQERTTIGALATRTAGVSSVDNQLEVKK